MLVVIGRLGYVGLPTNAAECKTLCLVSLVIEKVVIYFYIVSNIFCKPTAEPKKKPVAFHYATNQIGRNISFAWKQDYTENRFHCIGVSHSLNTKHIVPCTLICVFSFSFFLLSLHQWAPTYQAYAPPWKQGPAKPLHQLCSHNMN